MPKIVVTVNRSFSTRSKTIPNEKKEEGEPNNQTPNAHSRSKTPLADDKKDHKHAKEHSKKTVALAERKFFTVHEDNTILNMMKTLENSHTSRQISETISKKIKHSVESIRDRIKRFLTRIRPVDLVYIAEEAKANPNNYVHYTKENSKRKRTVSHIDSNLPKVAGSTLRHNERKALVKEYSRIRKTKQETAGVKSRKPNSSGENFQNMTTDELFRLRDDLDRKMKEKNAEYKVRLRKREPKTYIDPTEFLSPVIKKRDKYRDWFRESKWRVTVEANKARGSQNELRDKVGEFLDQLRSRKENDVEVNAQILAEIIKSFSLTFGVSNADILDVIQSQEGSLNVEDIRKKLLEQGE